jgi:trimethylamine:corrinoid methyltransferase-like protein
MDIVVSHRHLRITCSSMKDSDKTFTGMTTSGRNAEDVKAMCEILFGADVMEEAPVVAQLNAAALPTLAPYADGSQGRTRELWALPVDRQ